MRRVCRKEQSAPGSLTRLLQECLELLESVDTLQEALTRLQFLHEQETRLRSFGEFRVYFPERLWHLQCGYCVRDNMCWRGIHQGFQCLMFFLQHDKELCEKKRQYACVTEDDVMEADCVDLLLLAGLKGINVVSIPRMTMNVLRQRVLLGLFYTGPENYSLTMASRVYRMSRQSGEEISEASSKQD